MERSSMATTVSRSCESAASMSMHCHEKSYRRIQFPMYHKKVTPFVGGESRMKTELYWLQGPWTGSLAIMPRPRGGDWLEDEIRSWARSSVNAVVSLLTSDEIADLDLTDEGSLCEANGI